MTLGRRSGLPTCNLIGGSAYYPGFTTRGPDAPPDMITGENREAKVLEPVSVTYAEMTPEQRRLLEHVLDAYLGRGPNLGF